MLKEGMKVQIIRETQFYKEGLTPTLVYYDEKRDGWYANFSECLERDDKDKLLYVPFAISEGFLDKHPDYIHIGDNTWYIGHVGIDFKIIEGDSL